MSLPPAPERPSVLLAHPNLCYVTRTAHSFHRLGWDVHLAHSAADVHRLAAALDPTALVLASKLAGESGWLTCDKLVRQQPQLRVFLVEANPTSRDFQFAEFVGAAGLIDETGDVAPLVEEVLRLPVATAD